MLAKEIRPWSDHLKSLKLEMSQRKSFMKKAKIAEETAKVCCSRVYFDQFDYLAGCFVWKKLHPLKHVASKLGLPLNCMKTAKLITLETAMKKKSACVGTWKDGSKDLKQLWSHRSPQFTACVQFTTQTSWIFSTVVETSSGATWDACSLRKMHTTMRTPKAWFESPWANPL